MIVGNYLGYNGVLHGGILRLNTDGSPDNSFAGGIGGNFVALFPDDSIVVAGGSDIAALTPDGLPDNSKIYSNQSGTVMALAIQADGKVLIGISSNSYNVKRFNADGSPDASFSTLILSNSVNKLLVQPDGKILVGGSFNSANGFNSGKLVRLNANGTIDSTFSPNTDGSNYSVNGIALAPNGKITVSGNFTFYRGISKNRLAMLSSDGTLDTSFNFAANPNNAVSYISDVVFQTDAKIIAGANAGGIDGNSLLRINLDGSEDTTFQARTNLNGDGFKILAQPDGKLLVCGNFVKANGTGRYNLARFNANGSLDSTFNAQVTTNFINCSGLDIQADGKILATYNSGGGTAVRLNVDGSLDLTFPVTNNVYRYKSVTERENFNCYCGTDQTF